MHWSPDRKGYNWRGEKPASSDEQRRLPLEWHETTQKQVAYDLQSLREKLPNLRGMTWLDWAKGAAAAGLFLYGAWNKRYEAKANASLKAAHFLWQSLKHKNQ